MTLVVVYLFQTLGTVKILLTYCTQTGSHLKCYYFYNHHTRDYNQLLGIGVFYFNMLLNRYN